MEAELRELAGEGLAAVGVAMGGAFAPLFQEVLPHLLSGLVSVWGRGGGRGGPQIWADPSLFPSPPPPF